ncbi:MAG TPA: TlpA disulfide reductase family protein [Myxococcota bacterium]|jgi:thiol-disulfide isomerase/thioredoxin
MRRRFLPVLLALALAGVATAGSALDEGDRAPDFQARSISGDAQVVLHEMRGKVVLVDFWASWCAPCNAAMPQLEKLSKEFPADRFVVLGVNVDKKLDDARRALERRPVTYANASDPTGMLPKRFGLETMPTSYLIDQDGVVRLVHRGFRNGDMDTLREQIQKLLDKKKG